MVGSYCWQTQLGKAIQKGSIESKTWLVGHLMYLTYAQLPAKSYAFNEWHTSVLHTSDRVAFDSGADVAWRFGGDELI